MEMEKEAQKGQTNGAFLHCFLYKERKRHNNGSEPLLNLFITQNGPQK